MSIIGSNILAGASGQGGGYTIENSLRFRSSASSSLSRAFSTSGNAQTSTYSFWVKRGKMGGNSTPIASYSDVNNYFLIRFEAADTIRLISVVGGTNPLSVTTTAVYRDPSAWYHLVVQFDTTQAVTNNRVRLYVNGEQATFSGTMPAQNAALWTWNTKHIGQVLNNGYFDGYLTEVNFIDGQALTPSDFGDYNEDTGVWQPAKYSGTYGTNGFYLPFSDNTTTTTLAEDASGNGNDWTPNNISLTAGVTYDSMTDTPTPYADGGNYAVLNPLDKNASATISAGNLTQDASASAWRGVRSTIFVNSGKWYWETTVSGAGADIGMTGVSNASANLSAATDANSWAYLGTNGNTYTSGAATAYGAAYGSGDVIGVALDMDAGTLTFYKNNVSQGIAFSGLTGLLTPTTWQYAGYVWQANFGQRPFAYTPPTGFLPLHTGNLPDSAIVDASEYFNTVLWTGTGGARTITGVGFQPDWVWAKIRSTTGAHNVWDAVRGTNLRLVTDSTSAEQNVVTDLSAGGIGSAAVDGFTIVNGTSNANNLNASGATYVAWNWKANGAGVSNTDGSITSTVSANPTSGFSIVTYTGTGAAATVGHGLGVAPKMFICKNRTGAAGNWGIYNEAIGADNYLVLDGTNATINSPAAWNSTAPTSSVFTLGSGGFNINGVNYVAYCFAEVPGFSKFGKYTGNGSTDGTFVYLGFRPAFVMIKASSTTGGWIMYDTTRQTYNMYTNFLQANSSNAEAGSLEIDLLSNGFKLRGASANSLFNWNANGATIIYMAFAEHPFKHALAR